MKQISIFLLSIILLASCRKEESQTKSESQYLLQVKTAFKDSVSISDFSNLDWKRAVISPVDSMDLYLLRVPFLNKRMGNDFVLLQTNKTGKIEHGTINHLEGSIKEYGTGIAPLRVYNGSVTVYSLNRKLSRYSTIDDGVITALHLQPQNSAALQPAMDVMPEIIIVSYVQPNPGISYINLMALQNVMYSSFDFGGGSGTTGDFNYYTPMGGGGGGGSSYNTDPYAYPYPYDATIEPANLKMNPDYGIFQEPMIEIALDPQATDPAIDIEKYVQSFNSVPDAGASVYMEIFADVPDNSDPDRVVNTSTFEVGHTFIRLVKKNGSKVVDQYMGFYPLNHKLPAFSQDPIDSKFVDNSSHEYNASLHLDLTPDKLRIVLSKVEQFKSKKYDIDDYNCTDWALDVFNSVRSEKLTIPSYRVPGTSTRTGTRTPNGLYNELKYKLSIKDPETKNIIVTNSALHAGKGTGA